MDVTVMGAFQVNESGDFASWLNPSRGLNGVGNIAGSMDLAVGVKKLHIAQWNKRQTKGCPATARKKVNGGTRSERD